MSAAITALFLALCALQTVSAAGPYTINGNFAGDTFFSGFNFAEALISPRDQTTNNGDITYAGQVNATAHKLAYINDAGNAVLKVDDSSVVVYGQKRDSIRLESKNFYPIGSLFVLDLLHMPFGCSVWPSMWTKGANWPHGGEIDIIETVNKLGNNQYALHTEGTTCVQQQGVEQTGRTIQTNCNAPGNAGCTVAENKPNSAGSQFAQAQGGVFAGKFDKDGIFIWFWPRASIPESLKKDANTPIADVSDFGVPSAAYPVSACDVAKSFTEQQIIIQTVLCGDWAGAVYLDSCAAGASNATDPRISCYNDNVMGNGKNYADAYFEIKSLRVYLSADAPKPSAIQGGASVSATGSKSGNTPAGTSGSSAGGSSGAVRAVANVLALVGSAALGLVASLV